MIRLAVAALALILALAPGRAADSRSASTGKTAGIPLWKPVGSWVVLLLPLGDGSLTCTAITRAIPTSAGVFSVGFALSSTSTHFYLNGSALPKQAPPTVTLAVDGHDVATLRVLLHEPIDGSEQLLVADLPGAMLAREVLPAMMRGRSLEVTAGARHYAVSIVDFGKVFVELQQCAIVALAHLPRLSAR